jgi:hypothetical protein
MADFETRREERRARRREALGAMNKNYDSRIWTGVFLLIVGALALLRSFDVNIPDFLFSWQMLLIGIGIFLGLKHNFQNPTWFILILVGTAFLLNEYFFIGDFRKHIWPVVIISVGIFFIFRPKRKKSYNTSNIDGTQQYPDEEIPKSSQDFVEATSIFGSTKKNILTKNFRGGDITNIFGGTEINLSQADIQGIAKLDVTTIFGGAELIVPSHWVIKSEAVTIFGGIEDKRSVTTLTETPDKVLLIEGTILFGGIDIKSYK